MKEPRTRGIQNPHLLEQRLHVHSTPSSHSRPGLHVVFTSFQGSGRKPQEEERATPPQQRNTAENGLDLWFIRSVWVLISRPTACLSHPHCTLPSSKLLRNTAKIPCQQQPATHQGYLMIKSAFLGLFLKDFNLCPCSPLDFFHHSLA